MSALVVLRAKSRTERTRDRIQEAAHAAGVKVQRISKNPEAMGLVGIAAAGCALFAAPTVVVGGVIGWQVAKAGCVIGEKIANRDK